MNLSEYKKLKTAGGVTYNYYAKPAKDGKATLLFTHGFPDTSRGWRFVAPHFEKLGYGIVVPDLLGAGGTDTPLDEESYTTKNMSASLISILDEEKVDKVVVVGHDHGSRMASSFVLWYPERASKLALVSVGYWAPGPGTDIEDLNKQAKAFLGYETFGYWPLLIDEPELLEEEGAGESWLHLIYPNNPDVWRDWLCPMGKAKEWITSRKTGTLAPWVDEEDRQQIINTNYKAQTRWYSVNTKGNNWVQEQTIPDERRAKLTLPVLMVNAKHDWPCNPKLNEAAMPSICENLIMVTVDSDHWVQRWVPDQLNKHLENFLTK